MPIDYSHLPLKLTGLTEREQIKDTLYRCLLSFDSGSKQLFESAITSDRESFSMKIGDQPVVQGADKVWKESIEHIGQMDTQHNVSGVRIDIKPDGKSAFVTANALNQHLKEGQGMNLEADHLLAGGFYELDYVKEAEEWRIKHFGMKIVWTRGSWAVLGN